MWFSHLLTWQSRGSVPVGAGPTVLHMARASTARGTSSLTFGLVTRRRSALANARGPSTNPFTAHRAHLWLHRTTMWASTAWSSTSQASWLALPLTHLVMGTSRGPRRRLLKLLRHAPVSMVKGRTLAMLGTCWWTLPLVLATTQMAAMEGNTCCQLLLTPKPQLVPRSYRQEDSSLLASCVPRSQIFQLL